MIEIKKLSSALLIVVSFAALGTSCRQATPEAKTSASANAANEATPLVVEEIRVGQTASTTGVPEPLTPKDPILLVVKTSGASKGAELEAKLFDIGNGRQVGLQTAQITAQEPKTTELTFTNDDAWSSGRYMVEVKLDGQLVGQRDFDVIDIPPPAAKGQ